MVNNSHIKKMIRKYGIKRCKNCGIEIRLTISNYATRKFCSKDCSRNILRKVAKEKLKKEYPNTPEIFIDISCLECGKEFQVSSKQIKGRKFCSNNCRRNNIIKNQLKYARNYRRFFILKRDNFRCVLCGASSIENNIGLHIDHLYPQKDTGLEIEEELPERLITLCKNCNLSKASKPLGEEITQQIIRRNLSFQPSSI